MCENALIRIRRGNQAELSDVILEVGELAFTTDTHKLFIGSDIGNLFLTRGSVVSDLMKAAQNDGSQVILNSSDAASNTAKTVIVYL